MNPKKYRRPCTYCSKQFNQAKAKYCSVRCQFDHDFKLRVALLESGQYPADPQSRLLKKYLVWKYGAATGKVPNELGHIDGDPNCHALTPTYRGLNRGNGRSERWGGRSNPLRGDAPKHNRLVEARAPFPLPRSLVELVEAKEPTLIDVPPESHSGRLGGICNAETQVHVGSNPTSGSIHF
jgi:hypothetical protein